MSLNSVSECNVCGDCFLTGGRRQTYGSDAHIVNPGIMISLIDKSIVVPNVLFKLLNRLKMINRLNTYGLNHSILNRISRRDYVNNPLVVSQ